MDFYTAIILSGSIIHLALGFLVYLYNRRGLINNLFLLIVIAAVEWIISIYFLWSVHDVELAFFWGKMSFLGPILLPPLLVLFAYVFPTPLNGKKIKKIFILLFIPSIFIIILVAKNKVISGITMDPGGMNIKLGKFYLIYPLYFTVYLIYTSKILLQQYQRNVGIQLMQIKYFFFGFISSMLLGLINNVIVPFFWDGSFVGYGPLATIFFVVFTTIAITRYRLFDIKIITVGILVTIMSFIMFVKIITSSGVEIILNLFIFIGTIFFSFLLVRSTLKDINDKERIEQLGKDLVVANEQLRQLDKQKSDFVSIASHQLRTPLTAIKGYASLILENSFGQISEKVREAMTKIFESSQRMVMIVENFLTVSRIEQGRMFYRFETLDIQNITKNMVRDMLPVAKGYNLEIRFIEDTDKQYFVRADSIKIKQVIHNLLNDSISHTSEGFINVSISLSQSGGSVLLSISDTGKGATKNELKQMFNKYEQDIDEDEIRKEAGVELFIVKEIVKAHQGKVWAESEGIDRGLTYFVKLPVVKNKRK